MSLQMLQKVDYLEDWFLYFKIMSLIDDLDNNSNKPDKEGLSKTILWVVLGVVVLTLLAFFLRGPWRLILSGGLMVFGGYRFMKSINKKEVQTFDYLFGIGETLILIFLGIWILVNKFIYYLAIIGGVLLIISYLTRKGNKKKNQDEI